MPNRRTSATTAYLTYAEAAEYLRVSQRTIVRYVTAGRLSAHRLPGGHPRLRRADVEALLQPAVSS